MLRFVESFFVIISAMFWSVGIQNNSAIYLRSFDCLNTDREINIGCSVAELIPMALTSRILELL